MRANYTEVPHSEDGKFVKIVWPARSGNAYSFIICYRKINQKDKLLYTDM